MSNRLVDDLQRQLALLKARKDITEAERGKLARSLRRRIRKAKEKAGPPSNPSEEFDLETQEEVKPKRSRRPKWNNHRNTMDPEECTAFLDAVATELTGTVELQGHKILQTYASMGFSGVLIAATAESNGMNAEKMAGLLIQKFRERWNRDPEWLALLHQGNNPIFCLGPVFTTQEKLQD